LCVPPRPPTTSLFAYTTLFRSIPWQPVLVMEQVSDTTMMIGIDGQGVWEVQSDTYEIINIYKYDIDHMYLTVPPISPGHQYQSRSEEHTSELQSRENLVCRLLL